MITRHKNRITVLGKSLRGSRNLSALPVTTQDQETPPSHISSLIQWLTEPNSETPPPRTSHRFQFTLKSSQLSITSSSSPETHPLTQPQLLLSCKKLLSSPTLLRSPSSLPPLTIEYSSPNIAKPLHMGHLRSTLTGSYVRNVAEFAGHECRSVCFLGDWGKQFGVLHAGLLQNLDAKDFVTYTDSLTLHELLKIYIESTSKCKQDADFSSLALRLSAELEQSFDSTDSNGKHLWTHTKNLTVQHLKSCYESLGITFDDFEGESTYNRNSPHTTSALDLLSKYNLSVSHKDGSLRVKTGDHHSILLKQDDSSVYLLRDIACAIHRSNLHPTNNFVYVVDQGQSTHFKNLFEILQNLKISTKNTLPFTSTHTHIPFGKVQGMSTRSGNFTLLSEVIDQGTQLMHESRKRSKNARNTDDISVSQCLAVSGLVVNALKMKRTKTYAFDWNEALKSNGNSGVALQYTVSRLGSLIKRVNGGGLEIEEGNLEEKLRILMGSGKIEVINLLVCLLNFEDAFWRSYESVEPCVLVSYSFNLTDKISTTLSVLNVIKTDNPDLADAALWLFNTSRLTLEKTMSILGIQSVGEF